ncbi:hypothetical protein E4U22_006644, partial [Claviceps purpurea]
MASSVRDFPTIKAVRSFVVGGVGSGGDYHNVQGGHWYVQGLTHTLLPCAGSGLQSPGATGELKSESSLVHGMANAGSSSRLINSDISTPCSRWEQYRKSRTSWGINVLGSILVEIEASDGTVGLATGFG